MALLILGLLLWSAAHLFGRAFPTTRQALAARLGEGPLKGGIAIVLALSVILMVIGYRSAPFVPVYDPPSWTIHVNNLLMLVAIALLGMGHSKGRARAWFRNPMLMGVTVWAFAHVLVNGDLASLILFLGLAAWANVQMAVIKAQEPDWERPTPGTLVGDLRLVVITIVAFAIITAVHTWLGVWPFPR